MNSVHSLLQLLILQQKAACGVPRSKSLKQATPTNNLSKTKIRFSVTTLLLLCVRWVCVVWCGVAGAGGGRVFHHTRTHSSSSRAAQQRRK
jgi:hypothetical protein